ncbi:HAD family hydrolase [Limnospira fusiformis KN01]|uniref:HAD family hydrolase n=1 Tax=Limnospira TaxID=2596745 RepID=UPI0016587C2C|nr:MULTISPECIES: HAD family hydrolase [Limnospira]MDT9198038.1 HAD family hydrolase [Limnospira sp. PMC 1042.18]ULB45185.1 HAD family hydrolase [Limnospira fusiformis KN01]
MLKSLYPQIDWQKVGIIGFDLDGTLYDEMEFIAQVYKPIARIISKSCKADCGSVYYSMLSRWLQKGSSYNQIFDEILIANGLNKNSRDLVIAECLDTFRRFSPTLTLPARVGVILAEINKKYRIFLLTDGSNVLQTEKFNALQLDRWFSLKDIVITGNYGKDYLKPSTKALAHIKALDDCIYPETVVYFGDREIDRKFAQTAGFLFVKVKCLIPVEGYMHINS